MAEATDNLTEITNSINNIKKILIDDSDSIYKRLISDSSSIKNILVSNADSVYNTLVKNTDSVHNTLVKNDNSVYNRLVKDSDSINKVLITNSDSVLKSLVTSDNSINKVLITNADSIYKSLVSGDQSINKVLVTNSDSIVKSVVSNNDSIVKTLVNNDNSIKKTVDKLIMDISDKSNSSSLLSLITYFATSISQAILNVQTFSDNAGSVKSRAESADVAMENFFMNFDGYSRGMTENLVEIRNNSSVAMSNAVEARSKLVDSVGSLQELRKIMDKLTDLPQFVEDIVYLKEEVKACRSSKELDFQMRNHILSIGGAMLGAFVGSILRRKNVMKGELVMKTVTTKSKKKEN